MPPELATETNMFAPQLGTKLDSDVERRKG
jgi:hypothetical protein